ncbi:RagB/SusD family nutrient uptake outer membrane protein [Pedobacter frigoris]|uniref:RagB/SusD family nutrient uptake outer membrane protein n=1 Tax=Pedobacter frigoris TaxID=2571272 RepID=UPI00292F9897|nr:RagB/SusD family nutrient uptake outer membrane protein [Pedobacter frigoris]
MKTVFVVMLISAGLLGCKKFLDIPPPKDQLIGKSVFTDDKSATAAIIGIYSNMMQTNRLHSYNSTIFTSLGSDELYFPWTYDPAMVQFYTNNILSDNQEISASWSWGYNYIYAANACIEGLNSANRVTEGTKNRLLGEAKFVRAFTYFYLVNLFGDVPLITKTEYITNAETARTPKAEIYSQIIADLKEAQILLPVDYATNERVRPNKWAATALLGRVYLYQKDWMNAAVEATKVIESGVYSPLPSLNDVFLKNSAETIWQLMPVDGYRNTFVAPSLIPYDDTQSPSYPLREDFVKGFEVNDQRVVEWIGTSVELGITYRYVHKYKITSGSPLNEYLIVLRAAELYLIRAEANANLNHISDAIDNLNIIRKRAGLNDLSKTLTSSQCIDAVAQERKAELFVEFGHRWLDLKRTGKLNEVVGALKPTWKPTADLWPIPLDQINANQKLIQNPGYSGN